MTRQQDGEAKGFEKQAHRGNGLNWQDETGERDGGNGDAQLRAKEFAQEKMMSCDHYHEIETTARVLKALWLLLLALSGTLVIGIFA